MGEQSEQGKFHAFQIILTIDITNEPSKEEWGSGKRNRKLVTGICVYSTFIGRNLSRCKQTLGRQADRTYIQPIIYTDMCTLCTGLTVAQSPIFRTLS